MTPTEQQILAQLECKRQLEANYEGPVDEPTAWLIEAIALLLRHQLELRKNLREEAIEQLNKDICKEVTREVLEELRNNGILR